MCVIKKIIVFLLFISFFNINVHAFASPKTILIIASYTPDNAWEENVLSGFKKYFSQNSDYNLKFEYLDAKSFNDSEYYSDTLKLLNLKYKNEKIDLITTLDDEAFDFVKYNLFNKDTFVYKHKIFFIGVNSSLDITPDEKNYISGFIDNQSAYESINLISSSIPEVKDIYVALDNNIYSQTIYKSISSNEHLLHDKVDIHYIVSNYLNDITENIKDINSNTSAILLCGNFASTEGFIKPKDTIDNIKKSTNSPIFTTLKSYILSGAIGGYINDGPEVGYRSAQYINETIDLASNLVIFDSNESMDKCIMDFKLIRKYKINPLLLPKDTIYINKSKMDFVLPSWMNISIWILLFLFLVSLIVFIFLFIINKKKRLIAIKNLRESEEREKIKTDFLIIMSHELRTPLNIILNTSKILLNKCQYGECTQFYCCPRLEYIGNNANRLLRSVNNSIDVAKLDSQVYDINYSMSNIVEVIENIVDLTARYAKDYDIDIIFDPEQEEIVTAIDIEKVEKIILNLISNSIKNIPKRGSIFISCRKEGMQVHISIEDNGRGMTDETKDHIFEKYYHSPFENLARSAEGSGIGLYIVKKFIDILDGTISVNSTLGVGTTFYIVLPIKSVDKNTVNSALNNVDKAEYLVNLEFSDISKRK